MHFVECASDDEGIHFVLGMYKAPNYHLKNGADFLTSFKSVGGLCCFKICTFLKGHINYFIQRSGICYRLL